MAEKGGYKHFMLKEIYEQPQAIRDTFLGRIDAPKRQRLVRRFKHPGRDLEDGKKGRAYRLRHLLAFVPDREVHAGRAGQAPGGGGYRVRVQVQEPDNRQVTPCFVAVTQSGETADTLAAMREAKKLGARTISDMQRRRQHREPGRGRRDIYPRGPGDRRRIHQGIHRPAHRAIPARGAPGDAFAGRWTRKRPPRYLDELTAIPEKVETHPFRDGRRDGEAGQDFLQEQRFPLPRARVQLPDGPGGRAQAEGNFLYTCRRLSGGGDEARADRAYRREHARGGARAFGRRFSRRWLRISRKSVRAAARLSPS